MTLLANDTLTQLAFSIYENKGVFALLVGSGLSRAAEIPTGWEITLDLVRRIGLARGEQDQNDWATWYRDTTGKEPNYSHLLDQIASTPHERRSILHSYIEPTEEERREGKKTPTAGHYAIADLVKDGYVRVLVNTNFDRLLENALRERGVEPTIVASPDALAGAEPVTHTQCYILKLHGDYKDARIRNTDKELGKYPAKYDALLDRILDEYGILICGWSGQWDDALRAAFLRAPNRRYPTFWAARGEVESGAEELINHRRGKVITIESADTFFTSLRDRVQTIEQTHRKNPRGVELLVASTKRFLAKPEYRVQLDEAFSQELDIVLKELEAPEFNPHGQWSQAEFRSRVSRYQAAFEALAAMAGVLGRWGDDKEFPLLLDIIQTLYDQAEKIGGGITSYLNLRSYPAVLVFTAYGLGLTRARRWRILYRLFNAVIGRRDRDPQRTVETLFLHTWKGTAHDAWKQIEGLEKRKTPLSDHLLELFSDWSKRFVGVTPDFEIVFEQFELLASLAHLERNEKSVVQQELANGRQDSFLWMPVGRLGWHERSMDKILSEVEQEPLKTELSKAGFGKGDPEFIDVFSANFKRIAARMTWM
ncbi:hypothetical protein Rvan_1438 [Rhodomicrobium vannielii ATCC 17100]|uniref:Uncharacterized protein n=1 Tax=Rhodomicrobium vannielii (strain ATCC 17100 / DSM 162 / LMG 4299 / NCIMB 10020 / ATH 3.1.1) TaxID=648757 RepID=E3I6P7_RHOVT|nr:SIR2 family protein [Rhodomicrobium vannielii]ADP70694.1 hypothetical protein Rvan_1438 [Rhodomicrobium vannielii ATCC 17100]